MFDEQHAYYSSVPGNTASELDLNSYWSILDIVTTNTSELPTSSSDIGNHQNITGEQDLGQDAGTTKHHPEHTKDRLELPITRVYTRRSNTTGGLQVLPNNDTGNEVAQTENLPIALRKGVRECTKHPLYTFLAYDRLGHNLHAFTCNLDKQ